jgi:hypothetical protein
MSIHQSPLVASLLIVAALSSYGCDDNSRPEGRVQPLGPSPLSFRGFGEPLINSTDFFSRGVTLQRGTITAQRLPGALCPANPPFLAPVTIVASADRSSDLFLNHVDMRFVDRAGVSGGSTTFARSHLVDLFGSTRIPRLGTRSFRFPFRFGCFGQPAGTLTIGVVTGDASGGEMRTVQSIGIE